MCLCMYVCVFAISSANSQQIFIKFTFPESTWNCPGFNRKQSGKIRIPEKNRTLNFSGFFQKWILTLFCDNKVFLVFQYNYFKGCYGLLKICTGITLCVQFEMFWRRVGCRQIVGHLNRAWFENIFCRKFECKTKYILEFIEFFIFIKNYGNLVSKWLGNLILSEKWCYNVPILYL